MAQESTAFKDAPDVIIMALKMLTAAGQEGVALVGDEFGSFREFNEMLSVGYFEKSHMGVSSPLVFGAGFLLTIAVS